MWERLKTDEEIQAHILGLRTTDRNKFAVALDYVWPSDQHQYVFESLMLRGWIQLIDISRLAAAPSAGYMRIFRVLPDAIAWHVQWTADNPKKEPTNGQAGTTV
jgi:hypothetical protein